MLKSINAQLHYEQKKTLLLAKSKCHSNALLWAFRFVKVNKNNVFQFLYTASTGHKEPSFKRYHSREIMKWTENVLTKI